MAQHEQDQLWVYNPTKSPFTVKWGGYSYELKSGEKRVYPRFIAEHFAKHLADAILLRREQEVFEKTGKVTPLVRHPVERPKIVNMILIGTYTQFQPESAPAGDLVARMVNETNSGINSENAPAAPTDDEGLYDDYGFVPDAAVGNLDAPETADPSDTLTTIEGEEDKPDNDGSLIAPVIDGSTPIGTEGGQTQQQENEDGKDTTPPKRTKAQLIEEADVLGLKLKGTESRDTIEKMIKNF